MMNPLTKYDAKLGCVIVGVQFVITGMVLWTENQTLFRRIINQSGHRWLWIALLLVTGAALIYGGARPKRCVRHIGQLLSWLLAPMLALEMIIYSVFPTTPALLVVGGIGMFSVWLQDVFHGKDVRAARVADETQRLGEPRGFGGG